MLLFEQVKNNSVGHIFKAITLFKTPRICLQIYVKINRGMGMDVTVNRVLDAKGLACPMPIVKTKKEMTNLDPGKVMEIQATDKGSTADIKAWADSTGNQYLGTVEDGDTLKHYLRKATAEEEKPEKSHPHVVNLEDLQKEIEGNEKITILDVREPAEYAFGHIPGAVNIPLGELEKRFEESSYYLPYWLKKRPSSTEAN